MYDYWFYYDYIHSDEWKEKSARIREKQRGICHLCGKQDKLQAHHLTYIRLGKEKDSDLVGLCDNCHTKVSFLIKSYRASYAYYEEALAWSWHDAVMLKKIPHDEPCILCNADKELDTSYDVSTILKDLMSTCENCRWEVFSLSAKHRAQYCPHDVSLAYGLRDAKRNAKFRNSERESNS